MITPDFLTPDLLFSYWIFVWFIIYYASPSSIPNPRFILYVAIIENILSLIIVPSVRIFFMYLAVIVLAKGIPLYLLRNSPIHLKTDIMYSFLFFIIYNIYLFYKKTNIVRVYQATYTFIHNGENKTPLFYLESVGRNFFNWLIKDSTPI